jgi:transposase-like protein
MIHHIELQCPHCFCTDSVKNGKAPNGTQRRCCNCCTKSFRFDYCYNACKPGTKATVIEMTLNGSGVRDTGRVLKTGKATVCFVLKNFKSEPRLHQQRRNGPAAIPGS